MPGGFVFVTRPLLELCGWDVDETAFVLAHELIHNWKSHLKDFSGTDLGSLAVKAALERAGIAGDQVDYVILGQVLQAGAGQMPARLPGPS